MTVRNKLFAGIVAAIPLIVTFYVLKIAYGFITDISEPLLHRFGIDFPGLGFAVTLLMLIVLGFTATNVFGQRMLESFEKLLLRVPFVATIYAVVKQVIDSVKAFNNGAQFKRVAYIEYPSPGLPTDWLCDRPVFRRAAADGDDQRRHSHRAESDDRAGGGGGILARCWIAR